MDIFRDYSEYYDLLYKDKDYPKEVKFLKSIIKRYADKNVKTILDIGCGTGGHAFLLAGNGYRVTGIDVSDRMLSLAKEKSRRQKPSPDFHKADIRNFNLKKRFDAVIAMFNVMGYQISNRDFKSALSSVRKHLETCGLFIFDVWFGPAVLARRPSDRVKAVKSGSREIIRFAHPELDIARHIIKVHYILYDIDKYDLKAKVKEAHKVRFFFYKELVSFLNKSGFKIVNMCPSGKPGAKINADLWNISIVCKRARNA